MNQKLFRYMDLAKFMHIAIRQELFFARLNSMMDMLEGQLTSATLQDWISRATTPTEVSNAERNAEQLNKWAASNVYVYCFSVGDIESEPLWGKFTRNAEHAICIQTTRKRIHRSLFPQEFPPVGPLITEGEIQYVDRDSFVLERMNIIEMSALKMAEYKDEREYRLFMLGDGTQSGLRVGVDIQEFIEKVIVSPSCNDWFFELIPEVLGTFGVDIPVEKSRIVYRK